MTNIKEVSRKLQKKNLINEIKSASNFADALTIKEMLQREGFNLNQIVYKELLIRCYDFSTALVLKKEMEDQNISVSEEIYIMIVKKAYNFQKRLELLEEMEFKEIHPTIKTYYSLIRIEENLDKAAYIFNRMKANYIEPDGKIYELLHKKFLGHREYTNLKEEIKNYESTKLIVLNFLSCKKFEEGIQFLLDENRITDPNTISKLLFRLKDFNDRIKLIDISLEAGLELDHIMFWKFLQYTSKEELAEENKILLRTMCNLLSPAEKQKLIKKFATHFGKSGGKVKFQIQLASEEEAIREKAIGATDKESFFYYHGKATGLTILESELEEELEYLKELKTWEDKELFKYELLKAEGIQEGIERQQEIKSYWLDLDVPIFIIIYSQDSQALTAFYNYSITRGLYPYQIADINQGNLSGCFFTDSIPLLQKVIETIDFNYYDVITNIFFDEGNTHFYETHPGSEVWLKTDYPKNKALMPRFLTLKEGYSKNISSLFSSLYNPVTFNGKIRITDFR